MADLVVTPARVALPFEVQARRRNYIANVALTAGDPVYLMTTGKIALADANAAGLEQLLGIALDTVGAGQACSVLEIGEVMGFDLSALNYGAYIYLSDTVGKLATTASATKTVIAGQVRPLTTVGTFVKTFYVFSLPSRVW